MKSKTAVITGILGQDGAYLSELLVNKNYRVIGLTDSLQRADFWRLRSLNIQNKISVLKCDIANPISIKKILVKYKPDEWYNLAGISSVAVAWKNPDLVFNINATAVISTLNLISEYSPHTKFFQASSAEIFGPTNKTITEKITSYNPVHPYGISKLAAHFAVQNFRAKYNIFAVNGILYNHESPLRDDRFVSKTIARSVARIAVGKADKIELGNPRAVRDFGFAKDYVVAMWLMLQTKTAKDFIIATGKSHSVRDFVEEACKVVKIENAKNYIVVKNQLKRKGEIPSQKTSPRAIFKALGWRATTSFRELVSIMVLDELKKL